MDTRASTVLFDLLPPQVATRLAAFKNYCTGERELRELRNVVPGGGVSIDVGAHRGIYTHFLSRISERVIAYEPNPQLAAYLRRAAGSNVGVRDVALGDRTGEAFLVIPYVDGAAVPGWARVQYDEPASTAAFKIATVRLDDEGHRDIRFIKIDAEGNEEAVLLGGQQTIRRDHPVLLVEIEQRHLDKPIGEVFSLLSSMGYSGHFLMGGNWTPIAEFASCVSRDPRRGTPDSRHYINNFLFWPEVRGTTPWAAR